MKDRLEKTYLVCRIVHWACISISIISLIVLFALAGGVE